MDDKLITALVGAATFVAGWLAKRPVEKADANKKMIESAQKLVEMAGQISEAQQAQLLKQDQIILQQKETIIRLQNDDQQCRRALKTVKTDYSRLEKLIKEMKPLGGEICNICQNIKDEAGNIISRASHDIHD